MGIKGLLPFVKSACRQQVHISEFSGQRVAVDTSCWLHRGVFGSVEKIAAGEKTDFYVYYCLKYIRLLLKYKIYVILVFDGQSLPSKEQTNQIRNMRRKQMKIKGEQLMKEGKTTEAYECFKQATVVTFEIVTELIQSCRKLENVDCIMSPYEADAQLTYLSQNNIVQCVISEDSDLIPFGCSKVFLKLDSSGNGVLYEHSHLHRCLKKSPENFDFVKFRRICILSGCDYLPQGLPNIGLVKAAKFFNMTSQVDLTKILPRVPRYLNMLSLKVSKQFIEDFIRAENTFLYQLVFDPLTYKLIPLNPYPEGLSSLDFPYAGLNMSSGKTLDLVCANIHPHTHQKVDNHRPQNSASWSIWNSSFIPSHSPTKKSPKKKKSPEKPKISAFQVNEPTKIVLPDKKPKIKPFKPPFLPKKSNWIEDDLAKIYATASTSQSSDSPPIVSPYFASPTVTPKVRSAFVNPFKKQTVVTASPNLTQSPNLTPSPKKASPEVLKSPFKKPRPLIESFSQPIFSIDSDDVINSNSSLTLEDEKSDICDDIFISQSQPELEQESDDSQEISLPRRLSSLNGCTVSGLSRKRKSEDLLSEPRKQQNLKEYFSRFAFKPPLRK